MTALAIKQGTALRFDDRPERTEVARERTPFQMHLKSADERMDERIADRKPPAPRKIPTKAAKKVETKAPEPQAPAERPPAATTAPTAPTAPLAVGTGPIGTVGVAAIAPTAAAAEVTAPTPAPAPELGSVRPLTPLEQALQDLVDQIQPVPSDSEESEEAAPLPAAPELALPTSHVAAAGEPEPTTHRPVHHVPGPAPVTDLEQLAELAATHAENASHVNLVIDDGDARIVLAVAVHGQDVRIAMRAGDDHVAASLARNAASLDHALHARGLDLAELAAQSHQPRDSSSGRERPRQDRGDRGDRDQPIQPFRIEEFV